MKDDSPLPGIDADDSLWDGARKVEMVNEVVHEGCQHHFERRTSRAVQCIQCGWGFSIASGETVDRGHVYKASGELIV